MTPGRIRQAVSTGRWRVLADGVYATFSGPVQPDALVWAAILRAGPGAAAGPRTTLWLVGAVDRPPMTFDVVIPAKRQVRGVQPFRVLRRSGLSVAVHPTASPPRLRVEEAVLDVADELDRPDQVVDLVIRVIQRRLTTAGRLTEHLARRRAHRWRAVLAASLADAMLGVSSALEGRWVHDVQGPHGLPATVLNRPDEGGRVYRDVDFDPWPLVVELDGRTYHVEERFRDRRRDNRVTVTGRCTLRYGWQEIVTDPCGVAGEVAGVLQRLGWPGNPTPCSPTCTVQP